jgi:hypothetical protein
MMKSRVTSLGVALATILFASSAFADKVAVLPFSGATSAATKDNLENARAATKIAVTQRGHKLPTDSEMITAETAVRDGVPDTSDEYRAAGRASTSQWTVTGRVEPRTTGRFRVEIEVCQIASGRVESLAREIDPAKANDQIGEMLALLLRPEGIGNSEIPWDKPNAVLAPAEPLPTTPPAAPPAQPNPPLPRPEPEPKHAYAEGHPIAVGLGAEVLTAVSRPGNAQGSATSVVLNGAFGYALDAVPGLELRADIAGAVAGPKSILLDAGARYAFMLVPTARVYAGPELAVGAFFTLGGDKSARFLGRGGLVAGIGLGERVQLEAFGDLAVAPGGAGTLVLGGGGARGLVRF